MKILTLLLLGTLPALAVPLNDTFANRISLGGGPVAEASGDNTGATLQSNENDLDSIGGASVWWKWTAPETAWVSVDTQGSGIDTVLAVLADGPALKDTYVVGYNDETGDPAGNGGSSRVIFAAVAGTEYHIAVHGFLGVQGPVQLHLQSGVIPPLRITSLAFAPGSVDVTTASQTIMADIGIASDAGFAEGALVLHRAGFSGITEISLLPVHRLSGTDREGIYRVPVPVGRYSAPGTWLVEVAVTDTVRREAVFGRGVSAAFEYDHVLPDGLTGLLPVVNTGAVDGAEPVLASFAITPGVVDTTTSPAMMSCQFRVTDALSGFAAATLTLYTPSGAALTAVPVTAAHRTLGTALDGTYQLPIALPAKMPSGLWTVSLLIRDAAGNPALYDGTANGAAFPSGPASGRFSVTGVPHGYWAWMYPLVTTAPGTQPNDDLDHDGIPNLLEYAFGLTVEEPDSAAAGPAGTGLPVFEKTSTGISLTYFRRSAAALTGLSYTPQFSGDLEDWQNAPGGLVIPVNDNFEKITVSDPVPGTRRFGRVRVSLAE